MQSTEWRPIPGYEGLYDVSSAGAIRALDRSYIRHGHPVRVPGRMRAQATTPRGYKVVSLSAGGHLKTFLVHRLVALAFLGGPEDGQEVCHGDGDRTNNVVSNLRWGTRSENMQDSLAHGTHTNAAKTHCVNGHEFTAQNTRRGRSQNMRVCIECRKRKEPCPLCGDMRTYHGMKSHLSHVHDLTIGERSWRTEFPLTYLN